MIIVRDASKLTGEQLESPRPDGHVVVRQARQHQRPVLGDGSRVGSHQVHEPNKPLLIMIIITHRVVIMGWRRWW